MKSTSGRKIKLWKGCYKRLHILFTILFLTANPGCSNNGTDHRQITESQIIRSGDIIFQTSLTDQSKAIQIATGSKYSHMGVIYEDAGSEYYVFEAVQPVKLTPLKEWIHQGENGHFVVKRLKNADEILTDETLAKMKEAGENYLGKDYDIYFEWSDDKMYCSELVWKIYYQATGLKIGQLEKLSDFDLSHDIVSQKLNERYGDNIPFDEKVISPAAMFHSEKLKTVVIE